ncbi:hypothetical protein ACLOJK_035831 [Asimina triloba]
MDTAIFSPSALFNDDEEGGRDEEPGSQIEETTADAHYVERAHAFPGMELLVREFSFHQLNANLLWPGTFSFGDWLAENKHCLQGRPRILELGSGTGALAIFLRKSFGIDITTSDFDDKEIEENIAYNCGINGLPVLPHIRHVKQYQNLIKTLSFLLKSYKPKHPKPFVDSSSNKDNGGVVGLEYPAFLMSWRRRIGKEDEALFFTGCENAGLAVEHLGSRVYCICPKEAAAEQ